MPHLDWSSTSPWTTQLGPHWKGTKLLGSGNNGSVALFSWHSPITSSPSSPSPHIREIAFKQTIHNSMNPTPHLESRIMLDLIVAKSPHIVRIYKAATPVGKRKEMMGIYIEYCPGGNLGRLVEKEGTLEPILERDLWGMFACLVAGVAVMEKGDEDAEGVSRLKGREGVSLVHYDIKLDNVFLGYKGPGRGHERYPVLKACNDLLASTKNTQLTTKQIGDFGCAQWESQANNPSLHRKPRHRGAPGWRAPEHTKEAYLMRTPRKGVCSNIFQIGLIMYCLLHRSLEHPASRQKQICVAPNAPSHLVGKFGYGHALCLAKWKTKYSSQLRGLIMHCLMYEPENRPGLADLQRKVKDAFEVASVDVYTEKLELNERNPPVDGFPDVDYHEEAWVEDWR